MIHDNAPERLRADARRNRDQILEAARALFITRGLHTPMSEIAQRAGVGVGTLYRRFPDRDALIQAVVADTVDRVVELARTAWDEEPDGWSALTRVARGSVELQLGILQTSLDPQLHAAIRADAEIRGVTHAWFGLLERIIDRAKAEGTMRADVGADDVLVLISALTCHMPETPPALAEVLPGRLIEIMLDGLRARPVAPLPGGPDRLPRFSRTGTCQAV